MKITNTKFTHEIIDLLINQYVDNEITPITDNSNLTIQNDQTNTEKEIQTPEKPDQRLVPSKTAKISPAVLLKLNTLKPFIKEQEGMEKTSINNIIDMLVESFVDANLQNRHSKAYRDMYKRLYQTLDNK